MLNTDLAISASLVVDPAESPDREPSARTLLPHQEAGVEFLHGHRRCLLLDEAGLGKTIQALALMARLRAEGSLGRVLVAVDSTSLAVQWAKDGARTRRPHT